MLPAQKEKEHRKQLAMTRREITFDCRTISSSEHNHIRQSKQTNERTNRSYQRSNCNHENTRLKQSTETLNWHTEWCWQSTATDDLLLHIIAATHASSTANMYRTQTCNKVCKYQNKTHNSTVQWFSTMCCARNETEYIHIIKHNTSIHYQHLIDLICTIYYSN